MNFEKPTEPVEKFPTYNAILGIISENLEGLNFEIKEELSDGEGIYQIEIITKEKDADGYIREYVYSRKSTRTGKELTPKIYVAYLLDDIPVGGKELHKF